MKNTIFIIDGLAPEMGPNAFWAVPEDGGDLALVREKQNTWSHPRLRSYRSDDRPPLKIGDKIFVYEGQFRNFRGGHKCFVIQYWDPVETANEFSSTRKEKVESEKQQKELLKKQDSPWLYLPDGPDWYKISHTKIGGEWAFIGFFPTKAEALGKAEKVLRYRHPQGRIESFAHKLHPNSVYVAVLEPNDKVPMALRKYQKTPGAKYPNIDTTGEVVREHCKLARVSRDYVVTYYREKIQNERFWQYLRSITNYVITHEDWSQARFFKSYAEKTWDDVVNEFEKKFPRMTVGNLLNEYNQLPWRSHGVACRLFEFLVNEHKKQMAR